MSNGTKAIMSNITGGKIMKVRWNACYAASNILRKEEEEGEWRTDLINCLLDMVINFHNFKVKGIAWLFRNDKRVTGDKGIGSLQIIVRFV